MWFCVSSFDTLNLVCYIRIVTFTFIVESLVVLLASHCFYSICATLIHQFFSDSFPFQINLSKFWTLFNFFNVEYLIEVCLTIQSSDSSILQFFIFAIIV